MLNRSLRTLLGIAAALAACTDPAEERYSQTSSAISVAESVSAGSCSTAVVLGLSRQIADEVSCSNPTALVPLAPGGNLSFTSNAVLPYTSQAAKLALAKVTQTSSIQLNSAFRTVAQQYLLYRWYQQGRCGIAAAASPGRSNHQSGRALDVANYSSRTSVLRSAGWTQLSGDPVHFDHLTSPDIRGADVRAFQRLWNRNHPNDPIAEDGLYGPQTKARLRQAPATGFAIGPSCPTSTASFEANIVSIDGPDRIAPGAHATYTITVDNRSATDWPATARIVVADGSASELYDAQTWTSAREVGAIGSAIAAGELGVIDLEIVGPMVTAETPVSTSFNVVDGTNQLGTLSIAVVVTPNGDEGTSSESGSGHAHDDEQEDSEHGAADPGELSGGCKTGGGTAGWLALVGVVALVTLLRRRGIKPAEAKPAEAKPAEGVALLASVVALSLGAGCMVGEDEGVVGTPGASVTIERGLTGCRGQASTLIPADGRYIITTFGGPGDHQPMSCGGYADGTGWYAASRQRYGCGAKLEIRANGKCVVAQADDYGPDVCVERAANMPIIDVSPRVSRALFGVSGAGYSDRMIVSVTEVSASTPLGECSAAPGGGGGGTSATTCISETLDREVAEGTCVQSASDRSWYTCSAGTWQARSSSAGCAIAYGFCESATLGTSVPPRTCVQAASNRSWYQCNGQGWVMPVDVATSSGPIGACAAMHPL